MMPVTFFAFAIQCFVALFCLKTVHASIEVYKGQLLVEQFNDKESFYSEVFELPISGLITKAQPFDACSPIQPAPTYANFSSFVLIFINDSYLQDDCSNALKIQYAAHADFDVAVLMSARLFSKSPGRNISVHSHSNEKEIVNQIPAVLVSYDVGSIIIEKYLFKNHSRNTYWLRISPNPTDFRYYIVLFSTVIGICFIIMLIFMIGLLIKCVRERRIVRRNRLSTRQVRQLGTEIYTDGNQYKTCAVCLEDYEEGERIRPLPCQHVFHIKCIDPWLLNNRRTCPLCKRKIRIGQSDSDSSSSDSDNVSQSSTTEHAPLLTQEENEIFRNLFLQAIANDLANVMNQSGEGRNEANHENRISDPNFDSEIANLLDHVEQPSTIGSVNNSVVFDDSDVFVDALAPGESTTSSDVHV